MALPIDEDILIERLRDPEARRTAFSDMVKAYSEPLYWHIRRMVLNHDDANDLLQNTFMKAWTGIDGFLGNAKVLTWLYRIATNETITFINRSHAMALEETEAWALALPGLRQPKWIFLGAGQPLKHQESVCFPRLSSLSESLVGEHEGPSVFLGGGRERPFILFLMCRQFISQPSCILAAEDV